MLDESNELIDQERRGQGEPLERITMVPIDLGLQGAASIGPVAIEAVRFGSDIAGRIVDRIADQSRGR